MQPPKPWNAYTAKDRICAQAKHQVDAVRQYLIANSFPSGNASCGDFIVVPQYFAESNIIQWRAHFEQAVQSFAWINAEDVEYQTHDSMQAVRTALANSINADAIKPDPTNGLDRTEALTTRQCWNCTPLADQTWLPECAFSQVPLLPFHFATRQAMLTLVAIPFAQR